MDAEEKLTKAASCKDAGTEAFKQQKHVRACKLWHRAMKPIEHDEQFSVEEKRRAREIKKGCNLNLAAAELKLGQHKAAVASCDKVSRFWVQISSATVWLGKVAALHPHRTACMPNAMHRACFLAHTNPELPGPLPWLGHSLAWTARCA